MFLDFARKYEPEALSVLRIVTGFLYLPHGAQKLFGAFGGMGGQGATAAFPQLPWFAGVLEFFGGLLILFGIFTREVAFLLCGEMAVAYFRVNAPNGFLPLANHGELAVLFCFVFLLFVFAGGGSWAVERLWSRPFGR
jgi:putative oxidoreductase